MYHDSTDSSPNGRNLTLPSEEHLHHHLHHPHQQQHQHFHLHPHHGVRKVKPLPKRRRVGLEDSEQQQQQQAGSGAGGYGATNAPTTASSQSQSGAPGTATNANANANNPTGAGTWSIAANFPNVEKVINSTITREQFMAHAGELAKRLTHQLQGRLPPDRMEFVQALLQPGSPLSLPSSSLPTTASRNGSADEQGLVGVGGVIVGGVGVGSMEADLLGSVAALVEQHHQQQQQQQQPPVYGPPPPPPPPDPAAKFDLDAVFAAGFEAGLAGAVNGFDPFDDCETWEEVAEIYYSHHRSPLPTSSSTATTATTTTATTMSTMNSSSIHPLHSAGVPPPSIITEVTSDLGRRGARDGDEDDEDDGDDRDYHDHLRQPGNTKKRKVPATNTGSSPLRRVGDDGDELDPGGLVGGPQAGVGVDGSTEIPGGSGGAGGGDGNTFPSSNEGTGGVFGSRGFPYPGGGGSYGTQFPVGRLPLSALSTFTTNCPAAARVGQLKSIVRVRGKLAGAMVAGIQHKEMLKARKRQLAAVMGVLSQGDTLALDQALSMVGNTGSFGGPLSSSSNPPTAGSGHLRTGDEKENQGEEQSAPPVRLSRRASARMTRAVVRTMNSGGTRHARSLPSRKFTFACDSATKARLIATKEEVTTLRKRFEAELERQAENAAKLAAANKSQASAPSTAASTPAKGTKPKKTKTGGSPSKNKSAQGAVGGAQAKSQQTHQQQQPLGSLQQKGGAQQLSGSGTDRTANQHLQQQRPQGQAQHQQPLPSPPAPPPPVQQGKAKKKKRSALANASNPHHLRNYVPSRLPHSAGGGGSLNPGGPNGNTNNVNNGLLGPLPLRFLTADLPPRRGSGSGNDVGGGGTGGKKQKGSGGSNAGSHTNANGSSNNNTSAMLSLLVPGDEWICAFCEYDLFFGDDVAFRKAVRSRKKILKRRRRARERAAAAASGVKTFGKGGTAAAAQQPPSANSASVPAPLNNGVPHAAAPPPQTGVGTGHVPMNRNGGHSVNGKSGSNPNSTNTISQNEGSDEDYDLDLADFDDGDLGYEAGGNGKDAFGNAPKHQTKAKTGGGRVGGRDNVQMIPAAG